ncbi:metallophosphoesterase family protein [Calothrix sp. 336/3]|uniref:metallophosphoesterase family protein n=1 Tax=Calothrix sp. 336/3 TaxID=1337936 RepID=UPI0004E3E8BC|nr:metallophosphoesterase [Calothrix sp. 336/3]AKG20307.1 metallophosphoesterase [Calothrix sp. 336/3]
MRFISEPPIPVKIQKMKERVRWMHPSIVQRGIDQTAMVLDDGKEENPEFSFLVMGDSGTQSHYQQNPQRLVAELMLPHLEECRFALHTGDVVYMVGSHEYYPQNFIEPYREFLVGGENWKNIHSDRMVFKTPILPVLGNHDYYDVPLMYRLIAGMTLPLRKLFRYKDVEIGWHGSNQGKAYAQAFLDYLKAYLSPEQIALHLDKYYTGKTDTGRCLRYQPGHFTRLPNRYYTFRYGGIDFFALDSNTFNKPIPLPDTLEGTNYRQKLAKQRQEIEQEELQLLEACNKCDPENSEQLDALQAKLYQIDEVKIDIEKQLASHAEDTTDWEQLQWLRDRLIASWENPQVRGRIIYFHHPPFVTEASKWHQAQTLAVRRRLRWVFDAVAAKVTNITEGRSIVDLIFNGHAHCLEYLHTVDTGHADSHLNCIICGGSGRRPRRQRPEGGDLAEIFEVPEGRVIRKVADSKLFLGRNGYSSTKRLPYSSLRVDVQPGNPPKFILKPLVVERFAGEWHYPELEPLIMG